MNENVDSVSGAGSGADGHTSLIDFPAELSVKAMGLNSEDFQSRVTTLITPLLLPEGLTKVQTRESSQGKYLSVRLYFTARDHAQLESVYRALQADPHVLFTL